MIRRRVGLACQARAPTVYRSTAQSADERRLNFIG